MALLHVPPTQVIPYDAERVVKHQKTMDEFRAEAAKNWNSPVGGEEKFGAFRRSRTYSWDQPYDGLLQTYFIFPGMVQASDSELARIAVLLRKDSCQMLGSSVVWGANWSSSLPTGLKSSSLNELRNMAQRSFEPITSPVRLSLETFGYWGTALAWVTEAFVGEKLSAEGRVVHSDLAGLACFRTIQSTAAKASSTHEIRKDVVKESQNVLRRGHRHVRIRIGGEKPKAPEKWPLIRAELAVLSLPFNATRKSIPLTDKSPGIFQPDVLARRVQEESQSFFHSLNEKTIKVSSRNGRFVTVERGLAYGLRIGMHLTGPQGAALHVIRFEASAQADDAAILLIRRESEANPLAAGSILEIDTTQFPARVP